MVTTASLDRFEKLDVLRGAAAFGVFYFHYLGGIFSMKSLQWNGMFLDPASATSPWFFVFYPVTLGWIGVPLFLTLSGFCIHLSYLKARTQFSLGSFYWRRFFRIYPPYAFAVLCVAIFIGPEPGSAENLAQLFSHLFLVHNLLPGNFLYGLSTSFWSLALEGQFYVVYPLMLLMRQRWGMERTLAASVALSAVCHLAGLWLQDWNAPLNMSLWTFPGLLWFNWVLGALLAERVVLGRPLFKGFSTGWMVALLVAIVASSLWKVSATFSFSLAALFCSVLFEKYILSSSHLNWLERAFLPVGLCSYSLYLSHEFLILKLLPTLSLVGLKRGYGWNMVVAMPVIFLIVLGLSWLLYRYIELPSIAFGKQLWKQQLARTQASSA